MRSQQRNSTLWANPGSPASSIRTTSSLRETPIVRFLADTPDRTLALWIAAAAFALYLFSAPRDPSPFDYFVRLANAMLHGHLYLTQDPSWLSELIPRGGVYYVPYAPGPAIALLPFVALFGSTFPQQIASSVFGGLSVGLAWLVLGHFDLRPRVRALLTAVFGFGTCFWYIAETGSAWYLAQTIAVACSLLAILLVLERGPAWLVGLLIGFAALSRLPVALTAPFYLALLLDLGWPPRVPEGLAAAVRTTLTFGIGMAVPLLFYAGYNAAIFGSPLQTGYTLIPGLFQEPWFTHGLLSIDYLPRHLYAIFFRSWNFVDSPPYLQPSWWGLSLFMTTPLFVWLVKSDLRDSRVVWALAAAVLGIIPDVLHGSIGFTQFGYRFSLDVQPLLFVVLAVVFERGMSRLAVAAGVAAIAINLYAVWAIGIGFVAY